MKDRVRRAKEQLMMFGLALRRAIDSGMSREQAFKEIPDRILDSMDAPPPMVQMTSDGRWFDPILSLGGAFALAWLECGFPELEPTHKLAASLMCTSVSPDHADEIPMPWRCFAISVPVGLLDPDPSGTAAPPELILVLQRVADGRIVTMEMSEHSIHYGDEPGLGGYAELDLEKREWNVTEAKDVIWKDTVTRWSTLMGRLIVGCCIEADRYRPSSNSGSPSVRVKRGEPKSWVVKLQRNVNLDVREQLRLYASRKTDCKVSVQIFVRGHHKWQPCGPDCIGRKWIHVEPYWRGPENAPILVGPHKMGATR